MLKINFNDYYVINSNKNTILFEKNEEDKIHSKDLQFVSEENVKLYSVSIDSNDNIYIIILSKSGELSIHIYNNIKWSKITLAQFDLKSNIYSQIELKIINNRVNIFYNYSNLSFSNIYLIQHLVYDKTIVEKHNVIRYASDNAIEPFMLDFDFNGNVHLIYSNNSQIYYTLYNPYIKKWNQSPTKISTDGSINIYPYLLVDSNDCIHSLWLNKVVENTVIKYKRMMIKGKDPYLWKEIKLPNLLNSNIVPIIFEEENILKIPFASANKVSFIYSLDSGDSWIQSDKSFLIDNTNSIINVSSNLVNNFKVRNLVRELSNILPKDDPNAAVANVIEDMEQEIIAQEEVCKTPVIDNDIISEDKIKKNLELLLDHQKEIIDLIIEVKINQVLFKEEILETLRSIENKKSFWSNIFG